MKFSMVGTGNIAWFMAQKFTKAGHQCTYVYGRNIQQAKLLADTIYSSPTDRIRDIKDNDDAVILAISDHAIESVASKVFADSAILIHTAGALSMDILTDAPNRAVIWPVYSFLKNNFPSHRYIPTAYEGNTASAKAIIRNLIHAFSDISFEADIEKRQWLHLGAVIGNNFINHLMTIDEMICKKQGVEFSILLPILQQTFDRIQTFSPAEMQTGPAIRHDEVTIEKHVQLLQEYPEWYNIYKAITTSIRNNYPEGNHAKD